MEAINLCKSYDGRTVLQNVCFQLKAGGHYALMGPSGSGKTTLLRLMIGLEKPDSGEIRLPAGTRFSVVFQEDRLLEQLTAVANVRLVSPAPVETIRALLLETGIAPDSLPKPVSAYSGGMKRRVALCRALLAQYDVLLLDEPYKGLDEDTRRRSMDIVQRETQGKTVILVTHDPREAAYYEKISW